MATMLFGVFDANRDGVLVPEETPAPVWDRLSAADADGDERVTRAEAILYAVSRMVTALDADDNGKLSETEAPKGMWDRLRTSDADGDGEVSPAEIAAEVAKRSQGDRERHGE